MASSAPSAMKSKSTTLTTEQWTAYASEAWHPHNGQKLGVKFLLEHAAAALLADPGCGKTSMVYGAFKVLKAKKVARKMLVLAPLNPCYMVWPLERNKWTDFHGLRVEILHGPKKDEALAREADVYVMNYDGLDWLLDAKTVLNKRGKTSVMVNTKAFKELGFDTLVVDELTKFKHPSSNRFKALKAVHHTFSRRWGLTGTPVPNGLIDLFGQCYILDEGRTFGPFITHFRQEYFVPRFDGSGYDLQHGSAERIYERIRPLALRLAAKDYVDMPEQIDNRIEFDLPESVRGVYDMMEDELITKIESNVIVAANSGVASQKCRQIANGAIYKDPEILTLFAKKAAASRREWVGLHNLKLDLLGDLIDELQGAPLLVAYEFKHDLERLLERFGKDTPYIGGGASRARVLDIEREWNAGNIPLLLGQPQSIGHGLNLQRAANHVAWFSMTWDLELYDQLNRRLLRQGSKFKHVFVHHIMARNTVDVLMFYALRAKDRGQVALFEALKEKGRKRRK